jgi:hypothetical protein
MQKKRRRKSHAWAPLKAGESLMYFKYDSPLSTMTPVKNDAGSSDSLN